MRNARKTGKLARLTYQHPRASNFDFLARMIVALPLQQTVARNVQ
jgi:hypothetical protein